jgi:hypothetical protein
MVIKEKGHIITLTKSGNLVKKQLTFKPAAPPP